MRCSRPDRRERLPGRLRPERLARTAIEWIEHDGVRAEQTQLGEVLPPDDFDAQVKMVMANLTKALAAGGAKIADVTKITIYICNPHDVPKARGLLQTYFAGAAPASTLCILRGLANPNFLLEIEAIAAV